MRKGLVLSTVLLSIALACTGCMEKTGDLGNKNIRSNAVRNQGMNGNGTNKMHFANDQANDQNRMYGERRENNNIVGMHGNSRIEASDEIAERVSAMPGIDSAFVMMTDHNAYVAVNEDNQGMNGNNRMGGHADLNDQVKDKIADQVKALSPSVENVYVSSNPDFIGRMEGYANEVRAGHPIQGLIAEFNALVERIFPAESGTRSR